MYRAVLHGLGMPILSPCACMQVLGTLITEWQAGAELCASMLADAGVAERCAQQLAAIALFFGFDGWLVNIENDLTPEQVQLMLHFLRCLSCPCAPMCEGLADERNVMQVLACSSASMQPKEQGSVVRCGHHRGQAAVAGLPHGAQPPVLRCL